MSVIAAKSLDTILSVIVVNVINVKRIHWKNYWFVVCDCSEYLIM
jgi:hypothetical protein